MKVRNPSNVMFNPRCKELAQAVKKANSNEDACQALFDLKACLTQKEGFLKNREILTGRAANNTQLARVENRLDRVTQKMFLLGCHKL